MLFPFVPEEELKGNYYNEEICGFCTTRSETALKLVINKKFLKMYGIFLLGSLFMWGVHLQNRRDFNRHFLGESYSCHLWLFQQWKALERRKYLPRGWAIIKKKERGGGGAIEISCCLSIECPHIKQALVRSLYCRQVCGISYLKSKYSKAKKCLWKKGSVVACWLIEDQILKVEMRRSTRQLVLTKHTEIWGKRLYIMTRDNE